VTTNQRPATQWTILEERLQDDTRRARASIAKVRLPDGVEFEQWVLRLQPAVMVAMVDDDLRVLLMYRHRFVIDQWVWELPGGYLDDGEHVEAAAFREAEEETGWRPRSVDAYLRFQPSVASLEQPNTVYLARGAHNTGAAPDVNEAEELAWFTLDEAEAMIGTGKIVGAATVATVLKLQLDAAKGRL
jgi:8-oxo-dGTP pyrophosphatase MutT (NUDIX family)